MNVKPGDLAIQIKSRVGNEGAIVEILGPMGMAPVNFDSHKWFYPEHGFIWMVKSRPMRSAKGGIYTVFPCADAWLRPVSGLLDTADVDEKLKAPA